MADTDSRTAPGNAQRASAVSATAVVASPTILVWDLGVRVFHWLLVVSVALALFTGFLAPRSWLDVHLIIGVLITALLAYRIVWGAFGSTYARFATFVVSPMTALRHGRDLVRGRAHRHIGHNPVGTMMILALLAVLLCLTVSGTFALGGGLKEGPLAPFTTFAMGYSNKEIHELLAFALIVLIGLHVAGVAIESLRTGENLVRSMVSGHKPIDIASSVITSVRPRILPATVVLTIVLAATGAAVAHFSMKPAFGVPSATLDASFAKECSACHSVHHPSLAPAATWSRIMTGLADHFGDNAALDAPQTAAFLAYATANSADTWDSAAANRLRTAAADGSLRITETAGWQRLHRRVDAKAFDQRKVGGKFNCAACHTDASSGRFAPRSISIPQE